MLLLSPIQASQNDSLIPALQHNTTQQTDSLQTEGDNIVGGKPANGNAENATEAEQIEQHGARSSGMAEQIEQNVAGSSGISFEQDQMNEPRITYERPEDVEAGSSSESCKATERGGSKKTKTDQIEQGSLLLSEQLEQDEVAKEHTNSLEQEAASLTHHQDHEEEGSGDVNENVENSKEKVAAGE